MRKNTQATIIVTVAALILWQAEVFAHQAETPCSQIKYSPPEVSVPTYRLDRIEGQAVYASPSQKWELGPANGVCVTLLKRNSGELTASVKTQGEGKFEFVNIEPGEYVLIAFAGELEKINIPIRLTPVGKAKPQRLLLHLRDKADKRKSYVTPVTNLELRKELLGRREEDQRIRNEMVAAGVDHPGKEILSRVDEIARRNTAWMRSVIKEHGWPGPELIGWDGTEAAFILVQHADHAFQKQLLPLIEKAFKAGALSGPNFALFIDRVLVKDGKPQIYGTQPQPFNQWKAGEPALCPIDDEAHVDQRRAEVGLSSLAEYKVFLKKMYYPKN